jgi:hypothetical protein
MLFELKTYANKLLRMLKDVEAFVLDLDIDIDDNQCVCVCLSFTGIANYHVRALTSIVTRLPNH